ncbi:MFS transporter [Devosia nitrariae]|uniref:MFS transporter n=1 Tax=Devosia nitrariae TaxID=2071872 RepID=A0ABQ5W8K7_9HYPH|nr:MFS transporter [Devosia nitrariae]GLQ56063.1 MFS transporter [Devosia nitrariae]
MDVSPPLRIYFACFAGCLTIGSWYPRIADVQADLGLSSGVLGQSLAGFPVGTMLAFTLGAGWAAKLGFARCFAVVTPLMGLALVLATVAPSPQLLFTALLIAGLGQGMLGITGNVEADRMEAVLDRRVVVRAHGFWSLAVLVAGGVGAMARGMEIPPVWHLSAVLPLACVLVWASVAGHKPMPPRKSEAAARSARFVRPSRAILVLFLAAGGTLFIDNAASDWSVILMRDALGASPFVAGLGLTVWASGQTFGRLTHNWVADRFSAETVSLAMAGTAVLGLLLIIFASFEFVAILGFALVGLGTSALLPMALSAAARLTERPAAVNVAALSQLAFCASILSPLTIGWVAEEFGIRAAYGLGIAILAASGAIILLRRPFGALAKPAE